MKMEWSIGHQSVFYFLNIWHHIHWFRVGLSRDFTMLTGRGHVILFLTENGVYQVTHRASDSSQG